MSQPLTDSRFWRRVKDIFDAAWEMPEAERENYLASACGADAELRAEVEAMLAPEDDDSAQEIIIDRPLPLVPAALLYIDLKGQMAGRYRLVEEIGRGGMSVVYLGERADGDFEHRVAVKILRPGFESSDFGWRFSQERSILARLTHPHIARLIDGGETAHNLSYVVMDYIDGKPITEYCETDELPLEARLQLFLTVCAAVAHAHRHLIIHRDLKPGNIFVTNDGVPKLLDFGIAKLLDAPNRESQRTLPGLPLMTPEYASPEQVRGDEITTAGDVYSLGVVLYELLAGTRPHQMHNLSMKEFERVVCEQEPLRPSAASTTQFREQLRGDLDQIVMKALRKEPDLRYESADQLSDDLRRYLKGEPVRAQRDTLRYRTVKFVRRNRALAMALATIIVLLMVVIGILVRQIGVERERTRVQYRMSYAMSLREANDNISAGNIERGREILEHYLPGRGPEDLRGFEWRHLWRTVNRAHLSIERDSAALIPTFISALPHLEVPLSGNRAHIYDVPAGRLVNELQRDFNFHQSGVFATDITQYVMLRNGGEIHRYDRASDRLLKSFLVPGAPVTGIGCRQLSIDCCGVWVAQSGGAISLWDAERAAELERIETGINDIAKLQAVSGSTHLVLIDRNFNGHIFDRRSRKIIRSLSGEFVLQPVLSPSGRFVIEWIKGKENRIYDAATGRLIRTIDAEGGALFTNWIYDQPDHALAWWGQNGPGDRAVILTPPDFRPAKTFRVPAKTLQSAAYSPARKLFFTSGTDRLIRIWDYETEREIASVPAHSSDVSRVETTLDGRWLHTSTDAGSTRVWKVDELLRPDAIEPNAGRIFSVSVSPDGKTVAAAAADGRVLLYDIESGKLLKHLAGHNGMVFCVEFSHDGKRIASSGEDSTARIWDAATGNELFRLNHEAQIHSVAFSPDGRFIATGSDDCSVRIWDAAAGSLLHAFSNQQSNIWSVAFDPASRIVAAGDIDGVLRAWNLESRNRILSFQAHRSAVWSIRFTRDGKRMLTGSMDHTARLWDAVSKREILTFKGHTDEVFEAVFSTDEKRIVTAGNDKTVKIWNAATGEELLTFKDHRDEVWSVDFSRDGNLLVSAGWDGLIRLYRTQ
ncbi:MAG: protein kinase [Blastocatellales bacterium]|nr:protein kinase [Blastocatellales bacterium]